MSFNYITKKDKTKELFFKLPKALMYEEKYKSVSANAKLLYGMLLDRTSLSIENDWFDEEERAYIVCEISEVEIFLKCARGTASKVLKELENINLIKKLRLGNGLANLLYVAHVDTTRETLDTHLKLHKRMLEALKDKRAKEEEARKARRSKELEEKKSNRIEENQKFKNCTSLENTEVENEETLEPLETLRSTKNELLEVQNLNPNNTNTNNTDISMYVCSENPQTEKPLSFVDRYKQLLPVSKYALKTLPLIELQIEYDLFDKILVDTVNNTKRTNKENYIIKTLNNLIEKGISSLDDFIEDVAAFSYKKYGKSKSDADMGLSFSSEEIKEMDKASRELVTDIILESTEIDVIIEKSIASKDFFNALNMEYKFKVKELTSDRLYVPYWIREI